MSIDLDVVVLVVNNSEDLEGCLLGMFNLQEWMRMFKGGLTFLTKIEV